MKHTTTRAVAALVVLAAVSLGSCNLLQRSQPAQAAYVVADRARFEAVAPVIVALADADPSNDPDLTGVNGQALLGLVSDWRFALEQAEAALVTAGGGQ